MSLEQALQDNTAALKAFTAALATGAVTSASKATSVSEKLDKVEKNLAATKTEKAEKPAAKAAKEETGPDYETVVKPAVISFVKANTREAMDKILADNFDVKSAKELKPAQYQALLDLLKGGEDDVA